MDFMVSSSDSPNKFMLSIYKTHYIYKNIEQLTYMDLINNGILRNV